MKILYKMTISILFLMLLACNPQKGNSGIKAISSVTPISTNKVDSLPISKSDMAIVYPYSFKKYKGRVLDRGITLFLVKGRFNYDLYKGFYFFDDEQIPKSVSGIQHILANWITIDVVDLEGETDHKSKEFDYSVIQLKDIFSTYLAEDNEKTYGFRFWNTGSTIHSYFSYPNLQKENCYDFGDYFNLDNCVNLVLKEDKSDLQLKSSVIYLQFKNKSLQRGDAHTYPHNYNIKIKSNFALPEEEQLKKLISAKIPDIDTNSSSLSQSLKEWIHKTVNENDIQFTKNGRETIYLNLDFIPAYQDDRFLSYLITVDKMLKSSEMTYQGFTFDLNKKAYLAADDVFQGDKKAEIFGIVTKSQDYKPLFDNYDDLIHAQDFNLNNFFLSGKGIEFVFKTYQESSSELITVHVSFKDLKKYLNPDFLKGIKF